ncbi:uncharacterized protein LOC116294042 [Actinia tenebrosa]|uniref:Uncharacterized protein LOC116294042 n=1 Tax=Actinia tenebrosa TaxID=6105 RepID=A0A6P8HM40_ACTTE|nr:uncharacterized protein LOC116294042 [Actinia tenebrosa]
MQRSEATRAEYCRFMSSLSRDMLLFLDESAKDTRKLQRTMGHFFPGYAPVLEGHFVRKDRYSVLAAMDVDGIVATHTVQNAFSTQDFNFAIEFMIAPFIGNFSLREKRSVVILDNCRIHDSDYFINIIRERGGIVVFLP